MYHIAAVLAQNIRQVPFLGEPAVCHYSDPVRDALNIGQNMR